MILKNKPPMPWRNHCEFGGSGSATGSFSEHVEITNAWFDAWGEHPYAAGIACVLIGYNIVLQDAVTGPEYKITWEVPTAWDATPSGNTGWIVAAVSSIDVILDWSDHELIVNPDCTWEHNFSQLVIKYAVNGSAVYTTLKTIGPVSESGINWDGRYNIEEVEPGANTVIFVPIAAPNCSTTKILEPVGTIQYDTTYDYGWEYDEGAGWVTNTVYWEDSLKSPSACSCYLTPTSLGSINSYHNTFETHLYLNRQADDYGSGHSLCSDGDGGPFDWTAWQITEELKIQDVSYAKASPTISGIYPTRRFVESSCNWVVDYTSGPTTTVEAYTHSSFDRSVLHTIGHRVCLSPIPAGCPPPIPTPFDFCAYAEEDVLDWPTAPPCTGINGAPDCIHFGATSEYFFAETVDGDIYVTHSLFSTPILGVLNRVQVTSTGNCANPALWIAPNGILYVSYDKGSDCVYRFSTDYNNTWSGELTLFTGCKQPRVAVGPNGERLYAAFKYDSGTSGAGKIRVVSISPGNNVTAEANALDDTATAISVEDTGFDISFSNDFHGRWLLIYTKYGDTSVSHGASTDYGLSYIDVTP